MVGFYVISCKWRFFLFYCSICSLVPWSLLWILFLSADCYGVGRYNFIINDYYSFLGYVLHGVKCLIGLLRNYKLSSTVPSLDKKL
jgi:hypothetical protein